MHCFASNAAEPCNWFCTSSSFPLDLKFCEISCSLVDDLSACTLYMRLDLEQIVLSRMLLPEAFQRIGPALC